MHETPEKLIYPLEHAYTPAELGFPALKGVDAAIAGVLVTAAQQADCVLYLALLTIEESGDAEYADDYGSRRRWSEPQLEAGESSIVTSSFPSGGGPMAAALSWTRFRSRTMSCSSRCVGGHGAR